MFVISDSTLNNTTVNSDDRVSKSSEWLKRFVRDEDFLNMKGHVQ